MQLPDVIPDDLTGIRNYDYPNLSLLLEDTYRFRRHTGWGASCFFNPRRQNFVVVFDYDSSFVNFEIGLCRVEDLVQRRALLTTKGRENLAARINAVPREAPKDIPYSVIDRILNDNL